MLPARAVQIPGAIVDAVVIEPGQEMAYGIAYDPTVSGEEHGPTPLETPEPFTVRQVIARRAVQELADGAVVNYGFGIPDAVAKLVATRGEQGRFVDDIGELSPGITGRAASDHGKIDTLRELHFFAVHA